MPAEIPIALREAARISKAWPYEEARKLLKRYPDGPGKGGKLSAVPDAVPGGPPGNGLANDPGIPLPGGVG